MLVVDDEPLIRWAVAETLTNAGYDVLEAASGQEALIRLTTGPTPDVILLDYRLPDSNDFVLLETIRRTAPTSTVILMTAYHTPATRDAAARHGVFRVVDKPVEMHDVLTLVQQAHHARPT